MTRFTNGAEIGAEITTRVSQITKANGWLTDIGLKVFRGKVNIDDEQVPCASVIEGNDLVRQSASARFAGAHINQQYALVGYAQCDPENPNDVAHEIIRDLKRAIFRTDGKADPTWGGKVKAVTYRGRNIGPRADGAAIVLAIVEIDVEYAEDLSA